MLSTSKIVTAVVLSGLMLIGGRVMAEGQNQSGQSGQLGQGGQGGQQAGQNGNAPKNGKNKNKNGQLYGRQRKKGYGIQDQQPISSKGYTPAKKVSYQYQQPISYKMPCQYGRVQYQQPIVCKYKPVMQYQQPISYKKGYTPAKKVSIQDQDSYTKGKGKTSKVGNNNGRQRTQQGNQGQRSQQGGQGQRSQQGGTQQGQRTQQ
jgi:hypothetical protein